MGRFCGFVADACASGLVATAVWYAVMGDAFGAALGAGFATWCLIDTFRSART